MLVETDVTLSDTCVSSEISSTVISEQPDIKARDVIIMGNILFFITS